MIPITRIAFTPTMGIDRLVGVIGEVRFLLAGAVLVEAVKVRRTHRGALKFIWPTRQAGYPALRPWDDEGRQAIEQVLREALQGEEGEELA